MKFAAALLLAGWHTAMAEDISLVWEITDYPDVTATVGDTVTFEFTTGAHTVHIHPSGDCDTTDAVELGPEAPVTYTFEEADAGTEIFFACEVPGHCDAGQIVKFIVEAAAGGDAAPSISPKPVTPGVEAPSISPKPVTVGVEAPAPTPDTDAGPSYGGPSSPSEGGASAPASASGKTSTVVAHVLLLIGAGLLS